MQKLKQKLLIVLLALVVINPLVASAQSNTNTTPVTNVDVPVYQNVQQSVENFLCTPSESADGRALEKCINKLYRFGISFGAIALVFFLVYAGYTYIAGGESAKAKAKDIMQNALVGIALLLGSYVLLRFINPELVVFKPIQPPIFTAADLPSCEAVGLGENCVLETEDGSTVTNSIGGYTDCPDGVVNFEKSAVASTGNNSTRICKALMEKLKQINQIHKLTVTSTIRDASAQSACHKSNNSKSGACADIGSNSGDWKGLCAAIKQVGGIAILNESAQSSVECGNFVKTKYWSGPHLHIYLSTGRSGGTGGTAAISCGQTSSLPGVCGWTGTDPYGMNWGTNVALRQAFDAFNAAWRAKGGGTLYAIQAFRPQNYTNHIRSVWEANQLINKGKRVSQIASQGYGCTGRTSSFMTDAQAAAYTAAQKSQLSVEVARHQSNSDTPPACSSDHEKGIAVDISTSSNSRTIPSNYAEWITTAISVGLCHNIAGDEPHFALKSALPANTNCNQR